MEPAPPLSARRQKTRTPRTALREVLNAILYLVKTGGQWRLLPKNFPPWQTVYHHFRQWTRNGLLARLNHRLRAKVRQAVGKHAQTTASAAGWIYLAMTRLMLRRLT